MSVFVLRAIYWDNQDVVSVYADLKTAQKAGRKYYTKHKGECIAIEEWEFGANTCSKIRYLNPNGG